LLIFSKLYSLQESGATALGPALAVAIGMCQNKAGSKIVVATDGLANTGVGSMDMVEDLESAVAFYEKMAQIAQERGLIANVIGIKGDNLNMGLLGKIADTTGGDVDIVDPEKITDTFSSILENVLIATKVEVKLLLHKVLHWFQILLISKGI
jgi:Mg-chelatase subunit ChlD